YDTAFREAIRMDSTGSAAATTVTGNTTVNGNLTLGTVGNEFSIKEGTNASMGAATLALGTVTVNTTAVTANSRIFLTIQSAAGVIGTPYISARTAGTSFTITSTSALDTSKIAWLIVEPN